MSQTVALLLALTAPGNMAEIRERLGTPPYPHALPSPPPQRVSRTLPCQPPRADDVEGWIAAVRELAGGSRESVGVLLDSAPRETAEKVIKALDDAALEAVAATTRDPEVAALAFYYGATSVRIATVRRHFGWEEEDDLSARLRCRFTEHLYRWNDPNINAQLLACGRGTGMAQLRILRGIPFGDHTEPLAPHPYIEERLEKFEEEIGHGEANEPLLREAFAARELPGLAALALRSCGGGFYLGNFDEYVTLPLLSLYEQLLAARIVLEHDRQDLLRLDSDQGCETHGWTYGVLRRALAAPDPLAVVDQAIIDLAQEDWWFGRQYDVLDDALGILNRQAGACPARPGHWARDLRVWDAARHADLRSHGMWPIDWEAVRQHRAPDTLSAGVVGMLYCHPDCPPDVKRLLTRSGTKLPLGAMPTWFDSREEGLRHLREGSWRWHEQAARLALYLSADAATDIDGVLPEDVVHNVRPARSLLAALGPEPAWERSKGLPDIAEAVHLTADLVRTHLGEDLGAWCRFQELLAGFEGTLPELLRTAASPADTD